MIFLSSITHLYFVVELIHKSEVESMMNLDIRRTKSYYEQISNRDVCVCAYCQNYVREIKATYPEIAEYLFSLGNEKHKNHSGIYSSVVFLCSCFCLYIL